MPLTADEHARAQRARKDARNAGAKKRRAAPATAPPPGRLQVTFPNVVTWERPGPQPVGRFDSRVAYPATYVAGREVWKLWVQLAKQPQGWVRPPIGQAFAVEVEVVTGGKHDLDRIVTAVLDALQGGGAIINDCKVWQLKARRRMPSGGEAAHVAVTLARLQEAKEGNG